MDNVFYGYGGKVLKINLSTRSFIFEDLKKSLAEHFIGGKGFGAYFLAEYLSGKWDISPLSPDNVLIISSGPFNGTLIPMSSKVAFVFKSPQTNIYGESLMGGYFGAYMKWVGIDVVIISGRSTEPIYLVINEKSVEFKSAKKVWGEGIFKTEEVIKEELNDKECAVVSIGPAGENLVSFAIAGHDRYRQAGRAGVGAVMGSKKLKAIAIRTPKPSVKYYDEDMLRDLVRELYESIRQNPTIRNYSIKGTPGFVEKANVLGFFPTRYWSKVTFDEYRNITWESFSKYRVGKKTCYGCPVACHQYIEISKSRYGDVKVTLEYENLFAIGGLCEISDIEAISYINMLMDDYGIDTITAGNILAFAIEAYLRGKLKCERKLLYGDPECLIWLINKIVKKEGVGKLLADGVAKASEKLGLQDLAVHVKGLEPAGYDPRTLKSMILTYATSPRGACHLRMMGYHADLLGLGGGRLDTGMKKIKVLIDLERKSALYDSLPLCKFGRFIYDWNIMAKILHAVTGFDVDINKLITISDRIITLIRMINIKFGVTKTDDYLPSRFLREPVHYEGRTYVISLNEVETMLSSYYELRGWGVSGEPKPNIVRKLGLTEIAMKHGLLT